MTHLLLAIGLLFRPAPAFAQVSTIISGIGGDRGAGQALQIFETIHNAGLALMIVVSTAILVRAAAKMIGSISEEKMEEGRRSVGTTIMGIILINLTYAFVDTFWGTGGRNISSGAESLKGEILGLVGWAQVIVGILAVAIIVISAFKVIASFGKEDAGDEMKRAVKGAVVGVLLVVFDAVIVSSIGGDGGTASPTQIVHIIISIVRDLMGYIALVAVIMIIYAGVMMIVTLGNEDQYGKSKGLIVRVLIGLVIIMFSYFITSLIANATMGTL